LIPSLAAIALGFGAPALAQEEPASEAPEEDPLSRYRVPFRVLTNRTIGTTSVPVAFDWRRTKIHVGATGSFLFELNTFNTASVGGLVRVPGSGVLTELEVRYVRVWNSESSRQLALTPFRQPGKPSRLELDATVAFPLAEGVVTTMPRIFPAVQLVFNATLGFRYASYPLGYRNLRPGQVFQSILAPNLQPEEIENLEDARLAAMQIDPARYAIMAGFSNDIYFERGIFVSPRVRFALPLHVLYSDSQLPFWLDVNLAVGIAL